MVEDLDSHLYTLIDRISINNDLYQLKFTAPEWASGFECSPGKCGACCITDPPAELPRKMLNNHNIDICSEYDYKNRKCLSYLKRPIGCILYPFIIGVEGNSIICSTALSCPGTRSNNKISESIIKSIITVPRVSNMLLVEKTYYDRLIDALNYWEEADVVWGDLRQFIKNKINDGEIYPICDTIAENIVDIIKLAS